MPQLRVIRQIVGDENFIADENIEYKNSNYGRYPAVPLNRQFFSLKIAFYGGAYMLFKQCRHIGKKNIKVGMIYNIVCVPAHIYTYILRWRLLTK